MTKSKRVFELAIAFWIGIGLMSIIDIWKITKSQHPVSYNWIMFGFSILFIVISVILLIKKKKEK
jgi:tellurite resistance protein TehA-like permease